MLEATHNDGKEGPSQLNFVMDRMYKEETLCVPTDFHQFVIAENHHLLGHLLWNVCGTR